MKKKATKWEAAFYNVANRLCGNRVRLFEGTDSLKRRASYAGIIVPEAKKEIRED